MHWLLLLVGVRACLGDGQWLSQHAIFNVFIEQTQLWDYLLRPACAQQGEAGYVRWQDFDQCVQTEHRVYTGSATKTDACEASLLQSESVVSHF